MSDKSLRVLPKRDESLGRKTVMDRTLAAAHGVPYVHLVAFAIDTDRVRERLDESDEELLPMGWEIFLLEHYILMLFDGSREDHRLLLEEACLAVLDQPPGESPLGGQLPFAVYNAVRRGKLPEELDIVFKQWRKKPDEMLVKLDALWEDPDTNAADFAHACLTADLSPPPAPPTAEAWGLLVVHEG
ncbi:MAG: hypothetical protein IPK60_14535 [Sandaracinaceae bacterium]|nr:hypothetical protein [Sandaracinaceae bacterium]